MNYNKIGKSCNIDTSEICITHDINLSVKCQFERKIKSKNVNIDKLF